MYLPGTLERRRKQSAYLQKYMGVVNTEMCLPRSLCLHISSTGSSLPLRPHIILSDATSSKTVLFIDLHLFSSNFTFGLNFLLWLHTKINLSLLNDSPVKYLKTVIKSHREFSIDFWPLWGAWCLAVAPEDLGFGNWVGSRLLPDLRAELW